MKKKTNRRMVSVAMLVAIFLVAIDVTVVGTAMPRIVAELSGLHLISWVFAIYTLITSVTTPIYGKLADLFGRKRVFSIGVILFVAGSMLSGAAQTMTQLIWFRALQGIGAGAVMPITFTIIGDLFPGEQRARMQGLFSAVWGIAGLLGPLVGGFFVDQLSWRWIFFINLPVGAVSLVLVWYFLHEQFERKRKQIDYTGAVTFAVAMTLLLYALLNGGQSYAWDSPLILSLFAAAAVFLAIFLWQETRFPEPMLPLSLFGIRVIAVSNVASFLLSCVLIGVSVYLPLWIQGILGYSATNSGLTLMPMSIAWPIGAALAGRLMYRIGSKLMAVTGTLLVIGGSLCLIAVNLGSPGWVFVGIMILIGLGMGFSMTPFTVLIQSAVGWNQRGAATASNTFMRSLGQSVGIAVYGTWFNQAIARYVASHPGDLPAGGTADFSRLLVPEGSATIPAEAREMFHNVLYYSLHDVFYLILATAIIGSLVTMLMPPHRQVVSQQVAE